MPDMIQQPVIMDLKEKSFEDLPANLQDQVDRYIDFEDLKDGRKLARKIAKIDLAALVDEWVNSKPSPRTQEAYRANLETFFSFCTLSGFHPLLINARLVDRFAAYLADKKAKQTGRKLAANSRRTIMSAAASFYTTVRRYDLIPFNPFDGAPLPRKEYKKAVKTDQNKTIPVMRETEPVSYTHLTLPTSDLV